MKIPNIYNEKQKKRGEIYKVRKEISEINNTECKYYTRESLHCDGNAAPPPHIAFSIICIAS